MDWRTWALGKLSTSSPFTTLVPAARIRGSGSLEQVPGDRPFVVLKFDAANPEIEGAMSQNLAVWVHDDPGSYVQIDEVLAIVRSTLEGSVVDFGGVAAVWQGDSPDLSDDVQHTIVRFSSFRLAGRR